MKIRIITLLLLALFGRGFTAFCAEKENQLLESGKSPDGKLTAVLDDYAKIVIIDNKTKRKYRAVDTGGVLSMKWTGDSKTLVVVVSERGGNSVIALRMHDNEWVPYSADSRQEFYETVIREVVKHDTVELTYVGHDDDRENPRYYICSFTFHPETTRHTGEKVETIDGKTYERLKRKPLVQK